jgi:hypothetical protein
MTSIGHQQTFPIAFLLIGSFFRAFYFFAALFTYSRCFLLIRDAFYLFTMLFTYPCSFLLICDAFYLFVMLFTFS